MMRDARVIGLGQIDHAEPAERGEQVFVDYEWPVEEYHFSAKAVRTRAH